MAAGDVWLDGNQVAKISQEGCRIWQQK